MLVTFTDLDQPLARGGQRPRLRRRGNGRRRARTSVSNQIADTARAGRQWLNRDLLHLVERDLVASAIVELGRAGTFVVRPWF